MGVKLLTGAGVRDVALSIIGLLRIAFGSHTTFNHHLN